MNQLVATREAMDYNTCFFFYTILLSEWNMLKKAKAEHSQELHNVQQGHAQTFQAPQKNDSPPE